jgi:hypothetical protein
LGHYQYVVSSPKRIIGRRDRVASDCVLENYIFFRRFWAPEFKSDFSFALAHQNFENFTLESVKMATLSLFFGKCSSLEPENSPIQRAQSKIRSPSVPQ